MSDRVIYKGGTHVLENNTEGRIRLIQPKAGTINKFVRWWNRKGNQYIDCGIFRVQLESGVVVRLVIPHVKGGMRVEIRHDGFGNFTFPGCRLERIAVVAELSSEVLVEYQFSKVSGGAVLKRTLAGIPSPVFETPEVVEEEPEIVAETVDETIEEEPSEEPEADQVVTVADLKAMTKKQLLAWALEQGHDLVDNHTKAQLLEECIELLSAD